MTDNQYFYTQPADVDTAGCFLTLRDDEAHHCAHVLRKQPGDECYAVDGNGNEFLIRIHSLQPKAVHCEILTTSVRNRELSFELTVAAALIKPDHYEWMLEKCTELGASRFIPLTTARSHAEPGANRLIRWKKILLSAMKQSRRSVLPDLLDGTSFQSLVGAACDYDQHMIFHESADESFSDFLRQHPLNDKTKVVTAIGPEGGFTDSEIDIARDSGWSVLSLGTRRLRSETAAVCACSLFSNQRSSL